MKRHLSLIDIALLRIGVDEPLVKDIVGIFPLVTSDESP
jgi:hypothetical protein